MTPDEHAARAVEAAERAEGWRNFDRHPMDPAERAARGHLDALLALTHAVLALRPEPGPEPAADAVAVPDAIRIEDRDGDVLRVSRPNPTDVGSVAFVSTSMGAGVLLDADDARRVAAVLLRLAGQS